MRRPPLVIELNQNSDDEWRYKAELRQRLTLVSAQAEGLGEQQTQLEERRRRLLDEAMHLRALLGQEEPPAAELREVSAADLVVQLLQEVGGPLHYREVEERLRSQGLVELGGKDPANALLARYFNDPRLYRPTRGTYGLREWDRRARSVGTKRRAKRSR